MDGRGGFFYAILCLSIYWMTTGEKSSIQHKCANTIHNWKANDIFFSLVTKLVSSRVANSLSAPIHSNSRNLYIYLVYNIFTECSTTQTGGQKTNCNTKRYTLCTLSFLAILKRGKKRYFVRVRLYSHCIWQQRQPNKKQQMGYLFVLTSAQNQFIDCFVSSRDEHSLSPVPFIFNRELFPISSNDDYFAIHLILITIFTTWFELDSSQRTVATVFAYSSIFGCLR